MSEKKHELLRRAGPWAVEQKTWEGDVIERIELRTDGAGATGHYDMIYIYTQGDDRPWMAFPAHQTDSWTYLRP